jgi:predicted lipoprotein with Yx(FWY)xxD motif
MAERPEEKEKEMQMSQGRIRLNKLALGATALIAGVALIAAACGGGTSSKDKTATAAAKGGTTPAATAAATKPAATAAATSAATKAATTPAAGATTAASGAAGGVKVGDTTKLGKVLTDDKGMTLYTYKNDTTPGKSACNGGCATAWPPATAASAPKVDGATGEFTLITRDDGTKQVAYKGAPLYRYAADKAAGDTTGDGVGGVWSAAKP